MLWASGISLPNKVSSGAWRLAPKMSQAFLLKRLDPQGHSVFESKGMGLSKIDGSETKRMQDFFV